MTHRNTGENRDASLHAARYRMAHETPADALPVDEYTEATGRNFTEAQDPKSAIPHYTADEEVWEVANSALDAAFARGDFDNLAYAGKPIPGLGTNTDPDWWVKGLMEREKISGVGPPALMLRKEDVELEATLDALYSKNQVREHLEDFNARIVNARRQLNGGPPVVTKLRDVEVELAEWEQRRTHRSVEASQSPAEPTAVRGPWWKRWLSRG